MVPAKANHQAAPSYLTNRRTPEPAGRRPPPWRDIVFVGHALAPWGPTVQRLVTEFPQPESLPDLPRGRYTAKASWLRRDRMRTTSHQFLESARKRPEYPHIIRENSCNSWQTTRANS